MRGSSQPLVFLREKQFGKVEIDLEMDKTRKFHHSQCLSTF